MAFPPKPAFENSAKDKEPAGNPFGAEGSKREEAHDAKQAKGMTNAFPKKPNPHVNPFGNKPPAMPA